MGYEESVVRKMKSDCPMGHCTEVLDCQTQEFVSAQGRAQSCREAGFQVRKILPAPSGAGVSMEPERLSLHSRSLGPKPCFGLGTRQEKGPTERGKGNVRLSGTRGKKWAPFACILA